MSDDQRISVYNVSDLKNTSDDAIPNYLNSLGFVQSHRLADVRLALGYTALLVAGACFAWDYQLGFAATKHYSAAAVAVYAALNVALSAWSYFVERNVVYVGVVPASGQTLVIATAVDDKYKPVYRIEVTTTTKTAKPAKITLVRSFADWFDAQGRFVALPFQTALASSVPLIGELDPKRANAAAAAAAAAGPVAEATSSSSPSSPAATYTPDMLDMLAAASAPDAGETAAASATGLSQKKGGKRRKA